MSLWKKLSSGTSCLLKRSQFTGVVGLTRGYADHNPTPSCMNKAKSKGKETSNCKDDHPKARKAENIRATFPFYDMIKFKRECCDTDCIDADVPRFDKCLYKESDKNKRKYQVTWVDCPPVKIKPKKICCFAKVVHPPIERRKPRQKPETACKPPPTCENKAEVCPKIKMPRCRAVRIPVRCHRIRYPSDCVKVKAPYPSFSECVHPKLKKRRPSECHCWDEIPVCILHRILNKRLITGNTNMNPCSKD